MDNIELTFQPLTQERYHRNLYIQELKEFKLEEEKGEFTFDGYYYVQFPNEEDSEYSEKPPARLVMFVQKGSSCERFVVELLTRITHEDTSEYWSDEEEGGRICLFPTKLQTITFRVVERSG